VKRRNPLLTAVENRRNMMGLNDAQMSHLIGITHGAWHKIQHGERGIGVQFLQGVARRFPDLQWAIMVWLLEGDGPSCVEMDMEAA